MYAVGRFYVVYWEGEDSVTVLSAKKVQKASPDDGTQKEGSCCIVQEGHVIHTNGKIAACGKHVIVCVHYMHFKTHLAVPDGVLQCSARAHTCITISVDYNSVGYALHVHVPYRH